MPEAIAITSGQYITELVLQITNPTDVNGNGLGGTVNLSTFPNLTGITASGNGITQLNNMSGVPKLQTLRFENNYLTKQNLETVVADIYTSKNSITGSTNKNVNFNLTGASMGKIDRLIRLTGVNKYEAELDKLNFNVFYAVNGETDQTWTGAGTNNNFSNTGNWTSKVSPLDYDALYFGGTVRLSGFNDLPVNTQFNGITFNSGAGAFNLSGAPFVLTFDGINNNSTVTQTVRNDIVLSGNNRTINCTRGGINLLGNISGSGPLVKNGTGALSLSGNNTYTGNTFINLGAVNVLNSGPFGTGDVFFASTAGAITVEANSIPSTVVINNRLKFDNNLTYNFNKSVTHNGVVTLASTGQNNITMRNAGTVVTFNNTLSGLSTNTNNLFAANTVGNAMIFNAPVILDGALQFQADNGGGGIYTFNSTGNKINTLRGSALFVCGVSNTFSEYRTNITLGKKTASQLFGQINLNGTDQAFSGTLNNINTIFSDCSGCNIFNNSSTGSILVLNSTASTTYIGSISGNINLIKSGPGTLTTTGNMASGVGLMYTGSTTITGGALSVRTPFSDPLGKVGSGVFGSGASLTVGFAISPTNGESFRLLPGSTTNNYSIITLQGAAAGRTATYNRGNSTLTLTN